MSSDDLAAERARIERQILELERSLGPERNSLDLITLSSDSDSEDGSDGRSNPDLVAAGDLEAERQRVQREIEELERSLGSNINLLPGEDGGGSASEGSEAESEEELVLPQTSEMCLQMNLVYQEVLSEKMQELERLLADNMKQQRDLVAQMSGLHPSTGNAATAYSGYPPPQKRYLGHFLKPYFKDKITSLGPPANPETKEKIRLATSGMEKVKINKWMGWQKTLLKQAIVRDGMRRLIQPKLSLVDYLMEKMSKVNLEEKEVLRQQLKQVDKEVDEIRLKTEEELIGGRYDDHDWQKISNIDFEGTREADNIKLFWQNFLHPSINKNTWKEEEINRLSKLAATHRCSDWERIAAELGTNRTGFMCLQTYQRYIAQNFKRSAWEPHEDHLLRGLVAKMRVGNFIPYTQMSYFMAGREPGQLMYRWTMVLDPSLKKGAWSEAEDEMLRAAVAKYGCKSWYKIKFEVPGRNDGQCRDRYLDCLKEDVNKGPWERHEVELLKVLVKKHGVGKWAKIAAEIPNRLDHQCMQQWRRVAGHKYKRRTQTVTTRERQRKSVVVRSIKKRLIKLEEEVELSSEDEADEPVAMEFMDSDGEQKMRMKVEEGRVEEEEEEEEEWQEYVIPPMERWIPTWDRRSRGPGTLNTQLVELPSTDPAQVGCSPAPPPALVRCTILDRFGQQMDSVVVTDPPILANEHCPSLLAMVKVPFVEVKNLMLWRGRCANRKRQRKKGKQNPWFSNTGLHHALLEAVTPWVGHLLLPAPLSRYKRWEADAWRETAEAVGLTTTPVFLFFLQVLHIDALGCKKIIDQRRNPQAVVRTKTPKPEKDLKSVASWLKRARSQMQQSETQAATGGASPATPLSMVLQPLFAVQPMAQGPGLPWQALSLPVRGTRLPALPSPFPVQLPGHPGVCFVMAPVQQHLSPASAPPAPRMVFSPSLFPGQRVSLISAPTPFHTRALTPPSKTSIPTPTPSPKPTTPSPHISKVILFSTPSPNPPSNTSILAPTPYQFTPNHVPNPSLSSTHSPNPSSKTSIPSPSSQPTPTPSSQPTPNQVSNPSLSSTPNPDPCSKTSIPPPSPQPTPTPSSQPTLNVSKMSLSSTPSPNPPSKTPTPSQSAPNHVPNPILSSTPNPDPCSKTSIPTPSSQPTLNVSKMSMSSTPCPNPPSKISILAPPPSQSAPNHVPKPSLSSTASPISSSKTSITPPTPSSQPTNHVPNPSLSSTSSPPNPSSKTSIPTPSSQPTAIHISKVNLSSIPSPNPHSKASIPTPTPSSQPTPTPSSQPTPSISSQPTPTPSSQPTPNHVSNPILSSTPMPAPSPAPSSLPSSPCCIQTSPGASGACPGDAGGGPGPSDSPSVRTKRIRRPTAKAKALMEDKMTPKRKKARTQKSPDTDRPTANPSQTDGWILTTKGLLPVGGEGVQPPGSPLPSLGVKLPASGSVLLPVLSQQASLNAKPQTSPSTLSSASPQTVSVNPTSKPHAITTTNPNPGPQTLLTNPHAAPKLSANPVNTVIGPSSSAPLGRPQQHPRSGPPNYTLIGSPQQQPLPGPPPSYILHAQKPGTLPPGISPILRLGPPGSGVILRQASPGAGPILRLGPPGSGLIIRQASPGAGPILRQVSPGTGPILRQVSPGTGPILRQVSPGTGPILRQVSPGTGPILRQVSPGTGPILRQGTPGSSPLPGQQVHPGAGPVLRQASPDKGPYPSDAPTGSPHPIVIKQEVQVKPISAKMHYMDPSMMFLEEPSQVEREWQAGKAGVEVPGAEVALPYLAPFSTSLASLSALLRCKKSLTSSALQLLTPEEQAAGEDEQVAAVRRVVAERFGRNPAYAMLKARFLSCYTLPALLATINPYRSGCPDMEFENQEMWEWRGEELVFRIPVAMKKSRLRTDGTGAPATHYTGLGS